MIQSVAIGAGRPAPKPLIPFYDALEEAKVLRRSAWGLLWRELSRGAGAYDGLWSLIQQAYESNSSGTPPPVSPGEMLEVNRLFHDLKKEENRI